MFPGLQRNQNRVDSSLVTKEKKRRDWCFWIYGILVFGGEAKRYDASVKDAIKQLIESSSSRWIHSELKYIFALATAGKQGQLGVLRNENKKITFHSLADIDIGSSSGIMHGLHCMWNVIRWMRNVSNYMGNKRTFLPPTFFTASPFAASGTTYSQSQLQTTFTVEENCVVKSFSLPRELVEPFLSVYKVVKGCPNVPTYDVYFNETPIVFSKVKKNGKLQGWEPFGPDTVTVKLVIKQKGTESVPRGCSSLKTAIIDVLTFVTHFHKSKLVHMDLRWPNIILVADHYKVIDFELAGTSGRQLQFKGQPTYFHEKVFYKGEPYTLYDDVYQVGELICRALLVRDPKQWKQEEANQWDNLAIKLKERKTSAAGALELVNAL